MSLLITFVKFYHNYSSICDVLPLLVTGDIIGLVTNVAANRWSAHFQNFGYVVVTGSTYIDRTLIFLSFVSICDAPIEKSNNNYQYYFLEIYLCSHHFFQPHP